MVPGNITYPRAKAIEFITKKINEGEKVQDEYWSRTDRANHSPYSEPDPCAYSMFESLLGLDVDITDDSDDDVVIIIWENMYGEIEKTPESFKEVFGD